MKIKLVIANVFFVFMAPLYNAYAQEAEIKQISDAVQGAANSISGLLNQGINAVAQIGNLFGDVTGFRIGGTTGTAIATLILAKVLEDKVPDWVKWLLYGTTGTMFAGGGANILQLATNYFSA